MAQQHIRVLLRFGRESDNQIVETGSAVITGLTANPAFPAPPVDLSTVQAALTGFNAAIAAQTQGGTTATAEKNKKRRVLVVLLRKLASYVQTHCDDDLTVLLSSGFQAASVRRAISPLPKPVIASVDNGHSTQLLVKVQKVANAKCYELRWAVLETSGAPGGWQSGGSFTNSRSMPLNGFTPGATYTIQARAIGGSTGYSDWSDPVSHMCM